MTGLRLPAFRLELATVFLLLVAGTTALGLGGVLQRLTAPIDVSSSRPIWLLSKSDHERRRGSGDSVSWADYSEFRATLPAAAMSCDGFSIWNATVKAPKMVLYGIHGRTVCSDLFNFLEEPLLHGRGFSQAVEPLDIPEVIIGAKLQQRLGAGIGDAISIGERSVQIVGVLRPEFSGLVTFGESFWLPLSSTPQFTELPQAMLFGTAGSSGGLQWIRVFSDKPINRLASGALVGAIPLQSTAFAAASRPSVSTTIGVLLTSRIVVITVAFTNVIVLLIVLVERSKRDRAIRWALGGSGLQIWSPLLLWILSSISAGIACGLVLSHVLAALARSFVGSESPLGDLSVQAQDAFAAGILLIVGGVLAVACGRRQPAALLLSDIATDKKRRGTGWLAAAQVFLAVVTCSVAIEAVRFVAGVYAVLPSENLRSTFMFMVQPPGDMPITSLGLQVHKITDALASTPGVEGVAFGRSVYGRAIGVTAWHLEVQGGLVKLPAPYLVRHVGEGYLSLIGARITYGRDLGVADFRGQQPTAVVTESLARSAFGVADSTVLGRRIKLPGEEEYLVVVGVVEDVLRESLWSASRPTIFVPFEGRHYAVQTLDFLLRSSNDGGFTGLSSAQERVTGVLAGASISNYRSVRDVILDELSVFLVTVSVAMFVAGTVAGIAIGGVFATILAVLGGRAREVRLRYTLGATWSLAILGSLRRLPLPIGLGIMIGGMAGEAARRVWLGALDGRTASGSLATVFAVVLVTSAVCLLTMLASAILFKGTKMRWAID